MLIHLGLLSIAGIDAKRFLQGQLTCNLDEVTPDQSRLGAHCNPQGRVISLFRIFLHDNSYYLQMPRDLLSLATQALQKYAVFFKVKLTDASTEATQLGLASTAEQITAIAQGIPTIYPETSEKFLPHELNLPKLEAVSFDKGCYTGQEIIARMQYRGKLKNHLYRAKVTTPLLPSRTSQIYRQDQSAGTIVDYCQTSNNHYELLVIAQDTDIKISPFFIDPENNYPLTFLI